MKNKSPLLVVLLSLQLLTATVLGAVELDWGHDYDKALIQAKTEKKMVYLFIGADVCKFCKKFKEMTLSQEAVITNMKKNFVLLYMSRDHHVIPEKFEKFGVPRHYFLSADGEILRTEQGVWDVEGWSAVVGEVVSER